MLVIPVSVSVTIKDLFIHLQTWRSFQAHGRYTNSSGELASKSFSALATLTNISWPPAKNKTLRHWDRGREPQERKWGQKRGRRESMESADGCLRPNSCVTISSKASLQTFNWLLPTILKTRTVPYR